MHMDLCRFAHAKNKPSGMWGPRLLEEFQYVCPSGIKYLGIYFQTQLRYFPTPIRKEELN